MTEGGLTVSSTKIREFLLEGNVEGAALLLARPYDLDGEVARGAGRGRGFGFATANVGHRGAAPGQRASTRSARAGRGRAPGGAGRGGPRRRLQRRGQAHRRPSGRVTAEVHLFDFDGRDLYGEAIRLAFVARLREERRFPSVEALRTQIAADAEQARALLGAAR